MRKQNSGLLVLLAILILMVLLGPALGGGMMGPGMMGWYGAPGGGPGAGGWTWGLGMGLGWLAMLAFWGALIVGAVWLVRTLSADHGEPPRRAGESALDILKRRYAAGEITREEYEQMRQTLE